ncbi:hypothetical protein C8R45DRAFT_1102270 [Mycena sanguinolenta]|nr:hypothetical protein C8R45DRAFT_1102270 [Mycena sanguinolenta]
MNAIFSFIPRHAQYLTTADNAASSSSRTQRTHSAHADPGPFIHFTHTNNTPHPCYVPTPLCVIYCVPGASAGAHWPASRCALRARPGTCSVPTGEPHVLAHCPRLNTRPAHGPLLLHYPLSPAYLQAVIPPLVGAATFVLLIQPPTTHAAHAPFSLSIFSDTVPALVTVDRPALALLGSTPPQLITIFLSHIIHLHGLRIHHALCLLYSACSDSGCALDPTSARSNYITLSLSKNLAGP